MPDSCRKKMAKQGYNYLDRSIQEISAFFETRIENLETPAPPPAVRSLSRKKKKKNSKKRKAVSFEDSDKDSSDDEKPPSKKKYTTLKAIIKRQNTTSPKDTGKEAIRRTLNTKLTL